MRYANEHASCAVAPSDSLPAGVLELSALMTDADHRRQGYASKLLKDICDDADFTRVVLALSPIDAPIQSFYERFGFTLIQSLPPLMARTPQTINLNMHPLSAAIAATYK